MTGPAQQLRVPVDVGPAGALLTTSPDEHLRDLLLQVLFTDPGERVNRPDFGCGVRRLVFSAGNEVMRTTVQFLITQNIDRWLGNRIRVEQVDVRAEPGAEEILTISLVYVVRQTGARQGFTVTTAGPATIATLQARR